MCKSIEYTCDIPTLRTKQTSNRWAFYKYKLVLPNTSLQLDVVVCVFDHHRSLSQHSACHSLYQQLFGASSLLFTRPCFDHGNINIIIIIS